MTSIAAAYPVRRRPRGADRRDRAEREQVPREAWTRLAACTGAAALLQIDGTLITVALPSVARGLHMSAASTSLVLSTYFAAYALLLLPGGALVDRVGPRRIGMLGLGLFAFGVAAGALAPGTGVLLAARLIQGAGAGLVSPAALAGAVSGFPLERRGAALGIWGASAGMANLIGPLLGGVLTIALGWRANWWALLPLAVIASRTISVHLPGSIPRETGGKHQQPARDPVVRAATLIAALSFGVMVSCLYLAEQYLQRAAGYSALGASSVLVFVALLVGAAAPVAGRIADRRGDRLPAVVGIIASGSGLAVLGLPGVPLHSAVAIAPLIPVGLGLGMLFVPTSRAALNAISDAAHGRTSALLSAGRLLGAAAGAGLAGMALSGGASATAVHAALLTAGVACVAVGLPASTRLGRAGG